MLIIFDIDGTLLDLSGLHDHAQAKLDAARAAWGLQATVEDYWSLPPYGLTDRAIVRSLTLAAGLPDPSGREWRRWQAELEARYRPGSLSAYLLPGVTESLAALQRGGYHLVLGTGNMQAVASLKIEAAGLRGFFQPGGGFGSDAWLRSELISIACGRAGVSPHPARAAYVGDTPIDVQSALEVGVLAVAVTTGSYDQHDLSGADLCLSSLSDLAPLLA